MDTLRDGALSDPPAAEHFSGGSAFDAFVEAGNAFDAETAERLKRYVYSAGNTIEPKDGYAAFRGRAANVEPMLKKRGLVGVEA